MKPPGQVQQPSPVTDVLSCGTGASGQTVAMVTAVIAHEVNQPIAAVLISAEAALQWLMKEPPNLGRARQAIERVIGNGHRAANATGSIRDLIRQRPSLPTDLDINDVVSETLSLRSFDLRQNRITVETDLGDFLPPIKGDRIQLERLFTNLIVNAVEAMTTVNDRCRKLRIITRLNERGDVLAEVQDSGTGLSSAKIDRIFDPFFTTKSGSTGIGLSLCRAIVEFHGGRLCAAPAIPHGCVFSFILPADQHTAK